MLWMPRILDKGYLTYVEVTLNHTLPVSALLSCKTSNTGLFQGPVFFFLVLKAPLVYS